MRRQKRWKTILEYEIGVLLLVAAVLAAWFLPDLYTQLHDSEQFNNPILSTREAIQFLDVNSLDIAGRMKLLKDETVLQDWNYSDTLFMDGSEETLLKKAERLLGEWVDYGILPGETETLIKQIQESAETKSYASSGTQDVEISPEEALTVEGAMIRIIVGQSVLRVCCIGAGGEDGSDMLFLLMDADRDLLYYVAVFGRPYWDEMAQRIGPKSYDSYNDLMDAYYAGNFDMNSYFPANQWQNLARAASAVSCGEKQEENGEVEETYKDPRSHREFVLNYDTFDGYAEIAMVASDWSGYGMDVSLGTNAWRQFVSECFGLNFTAAVFEGWFDDPYGVGQATDAEEEKT